jgi:two-component system, LuxR family, sensor kinase FixL
LGIRGSFAIMLYSVARAGMDWVTITWSMVAAACLTLAAVHFSIWMRQRHAGAHFVFSCSAVSAAAVAGFELGMMRSQTPEQYESIVRWTHPAIFTLVVSLVCFVRLYLHAGRYWLAWGAICLRGLALVLNFAFPTNLNYLEITGIRQVAFPGGNWVSVAEGRANPWTLVGQLSSVLLLIFFVDALITVWRRGDRRRAIVLCGSTIVFIVLAAGHSALVTWGVIQTPYFISIAYLGIIAAMGYELSSDVVRAALLGRQLQTNETALRDSEQRMDLAAAAAGLAMWRWDIGRDEVWMSDRGRTLFGYSSSEPLNLDRLLQIVHPDDRDALVHAIANSMNGDGDYESEFRIIPADGRMRWIAGRGRVEFSNVNGNKPLRMRGVSIDITDRKQAELESQQQRAELAHLSRVTMLGELSASLAHELNQPLAAILSNAEAAQRFLARETVDLDEVRAILKDIIQDDNRAGEVIRRLRLLLKKGEPQRQELDLNETIQDVLKLVNSDLLNHRVSVHTELEASLPAVGADRVQMQQVLLNLIMNGCDAMTDTEVTDRDLTLRSESTLDNAVHVSVVDHGCGIPPAHIEKVFAPFFTTKVTGMGLGLAVCRTIISAHGGRLWASSNAAGPGVTFHFALPQLVRGDK